MMRQMLALLVILLVGCAAFYLGVHAWLRQGEAVVSAQDNTVGEMLLDEGLHLEANHADALALEKYRMAEHSRFEGAKNQRHLHLQLALHAESPEEAERHFALATQDDALAAKDPALWRRAWEGHCDAIAARGNWSALENAIAEWERRESPLRAEGKLQNEQGRCAAARDYYRGLAAYRQDALDVAEQYLRAACVDGYAAPRRALADLLHARGGSAAIIERLRREAEVFAPE
jgi:hypothetical protein